MSSNLKRDDEVIYRGQTAKVVFLSINRACIKFDENGETIQKMVDYSSIKKKIEK